MAYGDPPGSLIPYLGVNLPLNPDAPPACPEHFLETWQNADRSRRCNAPGCAWSWVPPEVAAMSQYLAEEARAADMAPLHERMFGHTLEPDLDFSCNGVDTDYPGGPFVIEKSGADEAVRAVMDDGIAAITRDIARGG